MLQLLVDIAGHVCRHGHREIDHGPFQGQTGRPAFRVDAIPAGSRREQQAHIDATAVAAQAQLYLVPTLAQRQRQR